MVKMTREALLDLYDRQLRAEAEVSDADEVTRIGPVWAATFPALARGFVTYQAIPGDVHVKDVVAEVVAHYEADHRVDHVEWKTRGHDRIPGLMDALAGHGFSLEEAETVMVGDVEAAIRAEGEIAGDYQVRRADTVDLIREAAALVRRVLGDTTERSHQFAEELVAQFLRNPDSFEMWLMRDGRGEVVCSGRVDFVAGTDVAGLWGGACDAAHRGRELYRAVTAARARSARARGKSYLHSDCTDHSRPILERAGLVPITTTTPAVWTRSP